MRIGEAAGLYAEDVDRDGQIIHIRRAIWRGKEQTPKGNNGFRVIDIDSALAELLRTHMGTRKTGRLFLTRTDAPISGNNIRRRILQPMLSRLGIKKAGLHAFRHVRITMLRKNGTPADLQRQWIGHASTRTTDGYSHLDHEREYRKSAASVVGLQLILGSWPPHNPQSLKTEESVKAAV